MKLSKQNLEILKGCFDNPQILQNDGFTEFKNKYEFGFFPNSEKVKDLQKRFCFDCLHIVDNFGCQGRPRITTWLYELGLNDDHIYTALKRVLPTVTKRY